MVVERVGGKLRSGSSLSVILSGGGRRGNATAAYGGYHVAARSTGPVESAHAEVHVEEPVPDIASLAPNYRNLVLWFGFQLVLGVGTGLGVVTPVFASTQFVPSVVTVAHFGVVIALATYAYRTARSLGSKAPLAWAIAMVVPVVNVITILLLSADATRVCRRHGIHVGFLGPRIS
jgi:hypothetical protein